MYMGVVKKEQKKKKEKRRSIAGIEPRIGRQVSYPLGHHDTQIKHSACKGLILLIC